MVSLFPPEYLRAFTEDIHLRWKHFLPLYLSLTIVSAYYFGVHNMPICESSAWHIGIKG